MNRDNESPIDPMREPELPEARERLAEVERQLKKARPRPVQLDGFELDRQARVTPLRNDVELSPSRRRRYRAAALVAGSWACGVLVGALVTFVAMQQGVAENDSPVITARGEQDTASRGENEQVAEATKPGPNEPAVGARKWTELEAAVLAFSVRDGLRASGYGRPSLRAGMYLSLSDNTPDFLASVDDSSVVRSPAVRTEDSSRIESCPAPSPEITPERLMRDLLEESSGFVL